MGWSKVLASKTHNEWSAVEERLISIRPSLTLPGMLNNGNAKLVATLSLVLSPCTRARTSCALPPSNSLINRCSLSPHSIHVGDDGRCGVRLRGTPPSAATIHTSPPVAPWSLISPPIKAIAFPSGDHRGTAICSPCSAPATSAGARIGLGVSQPDSPSACVYSFATHQLFSPGGSAATYARPFESGLQSNSYTCRLAGEAIIGAAGTARSE